MNLPTMQQLNDRQKAAEEKLKKLQAAYNTFLAEWEKIQQEEKEVLHTLHNYIDKAKLKKVTRFIENIND